jgi:hypothetical protein
MYITFQYKKQKTSIEVTLVDTLNYISTTLGSYTSANPVLHMKINRYTKKMLQEECDIIQIVIFITGKMLVILANCQHILLGWLTNQQ